MLRDSEGIILISLFLTLVRHALEMVICSTPAARISDGGGVDSMTDHGDEENSMSSI